MLLLKSPSTRRPEREYIYGVILADFLGLDYSLEFTDRPDVRFSTPGEVQGTELIIADVFLQISDDEWLKNISLPESPLVQWNDRSVLGSSEFDHDALPLLFRAKFDTGSYCAVESRSIRIGFDIFGSAFFMLSRYEEAVSGERDEHGRFPATASLAYRAGFLHRPIVDEYIEILWAAMKRLWTRLERRQHTAKTIVSCDVDFPFSYTGQGIKRVAKRAVGDIVKRRSVKLAANNLFGAWHTARGSYAHDEYRSAIDWIMEVNEQANNRVAFYFIPERTDPTRDGRPDLDSQPMRQLLHSIHTRGHEIGIHPGYNTYKHPGAMQCSVDTMRRVLAKEGIDHSQLGGRQHFLRWETPTTARLWEENNLQYDTTLGYADLPGFRCGTCRDFPLFDVVNHRTLNLVERPLIVMECSVIAERYMGLGYTEKALSTMLDLRRTCRMFNGHFTLLWHNSHLIHSADREFYTLLIE